MTTKRSSGCGAGFRSLDEREQPPLEVAAVAPLQLLRARAPAPAEALAVERLQQVVERVDVERPQRVAVEGGDEDDERHPVGADRVDHVEAVAPGICTSRNTRSGLSAAIAAMVSSAVPALGDQIDPRLLAASSIRSRSRASGSSSTISDARLGESMLSVMRPACGLVAGGRTR